MFKLRNKDLCIFITGSSGLFGKSLQKYLTKKKIKFKTFNRNKKKEYNQKFLNNLFKKNQFTHVINLAACTNVDFCEKNKKICYEINVKFLEKICNAIKLNNSKIKLIHFSTDQMYFKYNKNKEKNCKIKNYYTLCKIKSEKIASSLEAVILRTNFFGKSYVKSRSSFSDWIFNSLKNKKKIYLADDILFSPISIDKLIKIILKIINKNKKGIYNIGSHNGFSKYHFAYILAKMTNLKLDYLIRVKKKNINFKAKRNNDMRMKLNKFEKEFNIKLPILKKELKYIAKIYY